MVFKCLQSIIFNDTDSVSNHNHQPHLIFQIDGICFCQNTDNSCREQTDRKASPVSPTSSVEWPPPRGLTKSSGVCSEDHNATNQVKLSGSLLSPSALLKCFIWHLNSRECIKGKVKYENYNTVRCPHVRRTCVGSRFNYISNLYSGWWSGRRYNRLTISCFMCWLSVMD